MSGGRGCSLTRLKAKFTAAWLAWLAYFGVVEFLALRNSEAGDSLSEHVWSWSSIKERAKAWRLRRFLLLAFVAWLALHMLTGGYF